MTSLPIFGAVRLTVWGIGIVLAWLALARLRDWATARTLRPGEAEIALPLAQEVTHDALLLGGMAILAFSLPILQKFTAYLGADRYPLIGGASLWLLFWLECRMLRRLAYHPRYMARWALCWVLFAHAVVIVPVFL